MISIEHLTNINARGKQLDVEFKSDRRTLSDREIYEEVVFAEQFARGAELENIIRESLKGIGYGF